MKKKISILLSAAVAVAPFLTACANTANDTQAQTQNETNETFTMVDTSFADTDTVTDTDAVTETSVVTSDTLPDINEESTAQTTKAPEVTADTSISKADTSEMDFGFDESDTKTETATDDAKEISGKTQSTASGNDVYNITSGGVYTISGVKNDVMITVDADNADVQIILDGVTLNNSNGPAIYVRSADKVTLTLVDGTTNTVSDGSSYSITDSDSTLDAAVFSKADLTINGEGTLVICGNYKHGIVSKDDLIISSGTLKVTAQNVGLCGKDCVKINSGSISINAGSDGIRSDNDEDASRGYVYLYGGSVNITAGNDGIQAETVINVENVDLTVAAGGGSTGALTSSSESYKGLKAGSDIYITGGKFKIDSKDDCIHSNGTITISGGTYTLSSGDDGIHADTDLEISGASTVVTVNKSYEGIEATSVVITGGEISVTATDDGINAAGGNDSVAAGAARPGKGSFTSSTGKIVISGGDIYIAASGDGLDANGSLSITGGNVVVSGANSGDTAILDFDTTGTISGGTFIGTGASGMAQNFSNSSTQGVMMVMTGSQSAGAVITLSDSSGNVLLEHTSDRAFSCVIISSDRITAGNTYTLQVGSSVVSVTMNSLVYSSGGGFGGNGFSGNGFGGYTPNGGFGGSGGKKNRNEMNQNF